MQLKTQEQHLKNTIAKKKTHNIFQRTNGH